jgi:predicted dehydrogenase
MGKIKWGIMGPGGIARTFARSLPASKTGELFAVGSRALERAEAFGDEFGIPRCYGSYDQLLADGEVDAVYVALPNHAHLEWAVKTAQAGKAVLCEKPLTVNAAEAEQLFAAVRETGVFFMEAFMYRCHPQTHKLIELVRDGAIGEVRVIQVAFSYDLGDSDQAYANIRRRNDVAGGGIMDVGCYTTSMARLIAGAALGLAGPAEPDSLAGAAHIGKRGRVDEWAAAVARFPARDGSSGGYSSSGNIVANLICGTGARVLSDVRVWGSDGSIVVPIPWKPATGEIILTRSGKEPETIVVPTEADCYALEADVVAANLSNQEAPYPCMTWDDTLNNMVALDQWRASIGLIFDTERGLRPEPLG